MKHLIAFTSLLIVLAVTVLVPVVHALSPDNTSIWPAHSCRGLPHQKNDRCARLEAQMLSATVRVYFETWLMAPDESGYLMYDSVGHATVKDGRYLVTHNHTDIPLSIRHREGDPDSYTQVYLYNAAGDLRYQGSMSDFSIVLEDSETLVLAHGEGFFESLGFNSAQFKSWDPSLLEVGMEVAQIDWNGERTHVDWVSVSDFTVETGVPRISLENGVMPGASGGGVFWQGYHIANNWQLEEKLDGTGAVIGQSTTAALNSHFVRE